MRVATAPVVRAKVPRLWPESTIVILATGPSLHNDDVAHVHQRHSNGVRVIAVNDAYKVAPWADVLYACDEKWWGWHKGVPDFVGLKYSCVSARLGMRPSKWPGVQILQSTGRHGLDRSPEHVRDGHNSGYQAINVAVHLGAKRVLLLGYDMSRGGKHFFGRHPDGSGPCVDLCLRAFETLPDAAKEFKVEIVNCSRQTAIHAFPKQSIQEALP